MTIGTGNGLRSNSRSSKSAKYSASKVRGSQYGSGTLGSGSILGGQPLSGMPGGSKGEIKHRFEITKKLGSGTYGKVSLAYDHKTEKEVAVKLIKKSAIENKQDLVRIRREIRIMSALKHPNIIQIFEVFENRDKIILVMEYASGGELYDYVSTYGSLPEPEARRIFRQITSAVLYCHKHKVAHRDLKLENILLDANNNAKIADFGLSNYFSDKTLLSTFCGSPLYASPEIINGTPYRGPEVDCWSLGILLYTLVYGSMPFDGRDFNRMVRQIKRGAYFEPDTPSTASMLIRNMLRVNPERRADIDEIASHWWLNLDENMPVIQELPENQIVDHTPLTERAETMVVQDLADESDVFMDFGHLSASTRLKIEEFRRRRKEAEEYLENSPIKPPKARRTDGTEAPSLTAAEKSLRYDPRLNKEKERERVLQDEPGTYHEPLERLKRLESRLQNVNKDSPLADGKLTNLPSTAPTNKEIHRYKPPSVGNSKAKVKNDRVSPEQPDDPVTSNSKISEKSRGAAGDTGKPSFVRLDYEHPPVASAYKRSSAETWRMESDSLNVLMNQVLEQMEKGPVSMTLVARIKAHPFYDSRPMVKELLESILAAQPPSVQKQASKLIQQQSQELIKRQVAGTTARRSSKASEMATATANIDDIRGSGKPQVTDAAQRTKQTKNFEERPWHSVEVGFDPDEDVEHAEETVQKSPHNDEITEETVQDTSFEDDSDDEIILDGSGLKSSTKSKSDDHDKTLKDGEECDDEVEESDSEIDELGKEVEQIEDEENGSFRSALSSAEQNIEDMSENNPPPDPHTKVVAPQFVDAFDRGLAKRQSKGKYQHSKVELYGRGVSMECESPTLPHRRIGGPQPTIERSPFLFDKAKKYIMTYPKPIDDSGDDIPGSVGKKAKKNWLRTQDPDAAASSGENPSFTTAPSASRTGSVPPRSPPTTTKSEDEEVSESENDEDEEEESEEEESSDEYHTDELAVNKQSGTQSAATGTEQRPQTTDVEVIPKTDDAKCQMKSKSEDESNKTNASVTVKSGQPNSANVVDYADEFVPGRYATGNAASTNTEPTATSRTRTSATPSRPISPGSSLADRTTHPVDPFYAHNRFLREANDRDLTGAAYLNWSVYGQSGRYNDDNLGKNTEKETASPARFNLGTNHSLYLLRDERRKSKSAHDLSPDRPDSYTGTSMASKLSTPGSSNLSRFDNESWALEPKRFYVYQTRAEREAEKNTAVSNLHPSSTYRTTGSFWHSGAPGDRPGSTYLSDYKSRYDDNYPYRRNTPYDINASNHTAEISPAIQNQTNHESMNVASPRYRPLSRRIVSAFTDSSRLNYGRSHSMDRNALRPEDADYFAALRNRMLTPELNGPEKGEYSYVNYHDTAARGSTPHEPDHSKVPARGILKNKQGGENERRPSTEATVARSGQGEKDTTSAASGVKHMFDRLKRHLSAEKSTSPGPNNPSMPGFSYRNHFASTKNPAAAAASAAATAADAGEHAPIAKSLDEGKESKEEPSKAAKKRSLFLALGRRRTTEMRLGPDGRVMIAGLESDIKRPSSPIEKIKSLFRKSKESMAVPAVSQPVTSSYAHHDYINFPSTASTRYGMTDKVYGVYPLSHLSPSITREPFIPQYRKYTAGATAAPGVNYNRYSYTSGTNTDRTLRHWHEDPHLY